MTDEEFLKERRARLDDARHMAAELIGESLVLGGDWTTQYAPTAVARQVAGQRLASGWSRRVSFHPNGGIDVEWRPPQPKAAP